MSRFPYPKVKQFADRGLFESRLAELGLNLPIDPRLAPEAPSSDRLRSSGRAALTEPVSIRDGSAGEITIGNRFAILPMEGWDGETSGTPSDLVRRRWHRFGRSGAKLIWGEATAVSPEGRANPNQLVLGISTVDEIGSLQRELRLHHREAFGDASDLVVGLQLTHSGRWSRPEAEPRPRLAWTHSLLDRRLGLEGASLERALFSDDELDDLVRRYIEAATLAERAGFQFVDIKHCHGYLLHELLSARERPGAYGGSFEHRTRFLREVARGIRQAAPGLGLAVRLSAFDFVPFRKGDSGAGEPDPSCELPSGTRPFGSDATGLGPDLDESSHFLTLLEELGVGLVSITAGSPYYCPHIQRPAQYPPSDGYTAPEDPLVGVARLLRTAADLRRRHPKLVIVGSGYSYLQEWLPAVAGGAVEQGWTDCVGLGRIALSYPELPADIVAGREPDFKRYCRTFSDCTTAPRHGLISGCYPLDDFYKKRPERNRLRELKSALE